MGYRELVQSAIELLENDNRPEAESWKERAESELDYFPITSVCRADIEGQGYDASKVDDADMEYIARKMADAFCEGDYWIALETLADDLGLPERALKCVACETNLQVADGEYCDRCWEMKDKGMTDEAIREELKKHAEK